MWGQFSELAKYEKKISDADRFGGIKYAPAEYVKVRRFGAREVFEQSEKGTAIGFRELYHFPFEVNIGDRVDDKLVKEIQPAKGFNGSVYFWRVWVG